MKKFLFLGIAFFTINLILAKETTKVLNDSVYNAVAVDVKPEFPDGIKALYKFIGENYNSPPISGLKGNVYVSFIIEKDGSVTGIKVLKDIGYGTGAEAILVLSKCPNWIPGELNGQKVRCSYNLPILIQNSIETKPEFSGGIHRFIAQNYKIPKVVGLVGKVFVTFVVDIDGSLVDIKVLRDIGYGTGEEAIRVLNICPKWTPGIKDGKPVKCTYTLPIMIKY